MKKKFVISALVLASAFSTLAEEHGVYMDYHRKSNPGKQTHVNRAPMRLPIDVTFDPDCGIVRVSCDNSIDAEVYLLDADGATIDYSPVLNGEFIVSDGVRTLLIQGDGWYAEGILEF